MVGISFMCSWMWRGKFDILFLSVCEIIVNIHETVDKVAPAYSKNALILETVNGEKVLLM